MESDPKNLTMGAMKANFIFPKDTSTLDCWEMVHTEWSGKIILLKFSSALDTQSGQSVAVKKINQIDSLLVAKRTLRELKLLRHFQGQSNVISN